MNDLNKSKTSDINRGVELVIRRRKPKEKTFYLSFEKMVFFLKKEVTISFSFSFDIKGKN